MRASDFRTFEALPPNLFLMITNTELEYKGDVFPSKIVSFTKETDSVFFYTDNDVILKVTVLRDSMIRFRYYQSIREDTKDLSGD